MMKRGIMCRVRWALALVFPVAVMCCPGFPGCFPESRIAMVAIRDTRDNLVSREPLGLAPCAID